MLLQPGQPDGENQGGDVSALSPAPQPLPPPEEEQPPLSWHCPRECPTQPGSWEPSRAPTEGPSGRRWVSVLGPSRAAWTQAGHPSSLLQRPQARVSAGSSGSEEGLWCLGLPGRGWGVGAGLTLRAPEPRDPEQPQPSPTALDRS